MQFKESIEHKIQSDGEILDGKFKDVVIARFFEQHEQLFIEMLIKRLQPSLVGSG